MGGFDPEKWGAAVEKYLGRWFGRKLMQGAIIAFLSSVIIVTLILFFDKLVNPLLWPFLVKLFGGTSTGITLDNIEAIILVLIIALALVVVIVAIVVYVFVGALRRRTVPQHVIDHVAQLRSEGVSILNKVADESTQQNQVSKDMFVDIVWEPEWKKWADTVTTYLGTNFTVAEKLSFNRLGIIPPVAYPHALNPEHAHYLMQLSKQLTTLENLIERHLERR